MSLIDSTWENINTIDSDIVGDTMLGGNGGVPRTVHDNLASNLANEIDEAAPNSELLLNSSETDLMPPTRYLARNTFETTIRNSNLVSENLGIKNC